MFVSTPGQRRDVTKRAVIEAVLQERESQDERWGQVPRRDNPYWLWLPVLMEEVGEVATEMLSHQELDYDALSTELVQVAAVAIAWLEELGLTDD